MKNLKEICDKVIELTKDVAGFITSQSGEISNKNVEVKGLHDYVTYVDKTSEEKIVEGLKKILPDAGFITEEGTIQHKKKVNWIIDPLDGTTNFIHHLKPYAISIGLEEDDKMILGVIHELGLNETFYAWKDGGAFLNGNPIQVTNEDRLNKSLIATGFPYYDYDRINNYMKTLEHFMKHTRGVRRLGSAATDLAYVACGRFDGFYEYSLSPWDVAAGSIIVEEAGGKVSDFSGSDNHIYGQEIVASNSKIFNSFLDVIKSHMENA